MTIKVWRVKDELFFKSIGCTIDLPSWHHGPNASGQTWGAQFVPSRRDLIEANVCLYLCTVLIDKTVDYNTLLYDMG